MTAPELATSAAPAGAIAVSREEDGLVGGRWVPLFNARSWSRLLAAIDLAVLYLASGAALFAAPAVRADATSRWIAAIYPVVVFAFMHGRRDADERLDASLLDATAHVLGIVSLSAMLVLAVDSVAGGPHALGLALRLWLFALVYLGAARLVLLSARRRAMRNEMFATPALIVGAGIIGAHLARRLAAEPRYGLRPVGFLDSDPRPRPGSPATPAVPVLGGPDDLAEAVEKTGARHVIIAFSSEPDHVLVASVRQCQELDIKVSLVPRFYESINDRAKLDHVGGLPLVSLRPTNPRGWQFAVKHALDRALALVALLALAPVLIAVAIAIRLTSPGPVLLRQRRVGRDGRVFGLLKFRTMRAAEGDGKFSPPEGCAPGGVEGADRRTAIGRFLRDSGLDELPQLVNVLRGEMSLVGPRPERPEFVERFRCEVERYDDRHRVKSGITGWAQVHRLRGQTSIADRVEWDNYYIQNWSLRLDLRIVILTMVEVVRLGGTR